MQFVLSIAVTCFGNSGCLFVIYRFPFKSYLCFVRSFASHTAIVWLFHLIAFGDISVACRVTAQPFGYPLSYVATVQFPVWLRCNPSSFLSGCDITNVSLMLCNQAFVRQSFGHPFD
jgi:hypothetical protein